MMQTREAPIPILVVEDELAIRAGLCDVLAYHGYAPTGVERGDEGLERGLEEPFALAILDVMLPGLSGFEVCEKLRAAHPDRPILMLTARGAEEDVLEGFRCGGDDYVTKPFSIAELMARIEALLRRSGALPPPADAESGFSIGDWTIDATELCAQREEERLQLTRRDLEVLELFHRERGHIVSRRRLLQDIWGYADPDRVETRSVDMHIAKLRKKLGPTTGGLIETVRGEGYRLAG